MYAADARDSAWLENIPADAAIVILEGISMYLRPEELAGLFTALHRRFSKVEILMDCYTTFAAKASKYKNPINDVGVTEVYGLDEPKKLETSGLIFVGETDMTPSDMIEQLQGMERTIFRKLYAGSIARKMYRLYEYEK